MNRRILFIDDDENILATFRRSLAGRFEVVTTQSPMDGLARLQVEEPYAVVVADQRMPEMDGIELLAKVAKLCPDTVRIMLTGYAELETAILAVNEGSVFRFLTKPCETRVLGQVLDAALEQYRLVTSEKVFLRKTLKGCVELLAEIVSLSNPEAYGRAERAKRLIRELHKRRGLPAFWKVETAAMLSQIGLIFLPPELVEKAQKLGEEKDVQLSATELRDYSVHTELAAQLLGKIPYLEDVGAIIKLQDTLLSAAPDMPLGARALKLALDYDTLAQAGVERHDALDTMRGRDGWYDMDLFPAFERAVCDDTGFARRKLPLSALRPGMVLQEELVADNGVLLMVTDQELTEATLLKLANFRKSHALKPEINVLVPLAQIDEVDGSVKHLL
ncbi:response regulator receiver protein [Desulfovibrio sp. X2]|uniref:HD domain-containing phosphohydrolase n=1 Tax=Desulfovibrio sp. X2 TaxID=941449 RepID=UPI000358E4AA|nr:HD domain-containing phosphohydrolase [Desulfovibrio sp. X2]EPR43795.1 response regulator receiver protein [Desulfovibrio sp. X2]